MVRDIQIAFYMVLAFWESKFWNNSVLSLPHPIFECQNMIFFRENPVRYITCTLNIWTGYFDQGLSYPSPHILLKEFHWKRVVFVFPFDTLLFSYSVNSVLLYFCVSLSFSLYQWAQRVWSLFSKGKL